MGTLEAIGFLPSGWGKTGRKVDRGRSGTKTAAAYDTTSSVWTGVQKLRYRSWPGSGDADPIWIGLAEFIAI